MQLTADILNDMTSTQWIIAACMVWYGYFGSFLAGIHYSELQMESRPRWFVMGSVFLMSLIGPIVRLFFGVANVARWIWNQINEYTQVRFFWNFYMRKQYRDLPIDILAALNRKEAIEKNRKVTIPRRVFLHSVRLVNRVNNYSPENFNRGYSPETM